MMNLAKRLAVANGLFLAAPALMLLVAALSLLRERYKLGSYGLWPTKRWASALS